MSNADVCALMKKKKRLVIAFILNMAIVVMELIACYMSFINHGLTLFRFYTEDSNVLALIFCTVYGVYLFRAIKTGKDIPQWIVKAKYVTTCCLLLTFVVVVVILAPMTGVEGYMLFMFAGSMLYHHTLCPIFALVSFVSVECTIPITAIDNIIAVVPTIVYGAILLVLNAKGIVKGPYPFLNINNQTLIMTVGWILVLYGMTYVLAFIVRWYSVKKLTR